MVGLNFRNPVQAGDEGRNFTEHISTVYTKADEPMARVPNMASGIHCCPNSFYFNFM
jgi:hypothetical protein